MHSQRLLLGLSLMSATGVASVGSQRPLIRRPWVLTLLVVGIVLDLAISGALIHNNYQINKVVSQAHIAKVAAYEYCLKGNASAQADLKRWDAVLALLHDGQNDPQLETFIAGVEKANRTADQQTDCSRIKPSG